MKSSIFIPEKINVGFQERSDTYTKKLAYVIYFDETGKLRKEASWNSWRNSDIDNVIHENKPTSGFVLNKKTGGYSTGWNHRQTYVRVYDPRDFEFEISVANLLYILENTNSIKGKGLEGELVYGWDGTELLLMPVDAPDYVEIKKYNEVIHENKHIKGKELKVGATYLTKDNDKLVFLGKFDEYEGNGSKKKAKSFYFYNIDFDESKRTYYSNGIVIKRSLGKSIIGIESEECIENYADLMDILERDDNYSPIDESKNVWETISFEEFEKKIEDTHWKRRRFYQVGETDKVEVLLTDNKYLVRKDERIPSRYGWRGYDTRTIDVFRGDIREVFEYINPVKKKIFLANGKFYREDD